MKKVPPAAPFHSWKVGVPTFEFGMMHAILFQLAILPLTMCRLSIATLSRTSFSYFIPFERMTDYHIAVGYVLVIFLLATISIFFMFFGVICTSGDTSFCAKVSSCYVFYKDSSTSQFDSISDACPMICFDLVHHRNHDHRVCHLRILHGRRCDLFSSLQDQI